MWEATSDNKVWHYLYPFLCHKLTFLYNFYVPFCWDRKYYIHTEIMMHSKELQLLQHSNVNQSLLSPGLPFSRVQKSHPHCKELHLSQVWHLLLTWPDRCPSRSFLVVSSWQSTSTLPSGACRGNGRAFRLWIVVKGTPVIVPVGFHGAMLFSCCQGNTSFFPPDSLMSAFLFP